MIMRHFIPFSFLFLSVFMLHAQTPTFGIVIHGGAGTIKKENMTPAMEATYRSKLKEAIQTGYAILADGGSSSSAVEATIRVMEDSPLFNAAKGAVLTADGKVTLDASFMEGSKMDAGAVAGATQIKNPISAAIAVMNDSPHVLLSGEGANEFAQSLGHAIVPNTYFITERRVRGLQRVQQKQAQTQALFYDDFIRNSKYGTVGCVALDKAGNLAAGTSTGGMTNKKWGRIGDSPIIGAGTYANNNTCGVSATGWGEYFIRAAVAHDISAMMEYTHVDVVTAVKKSLQKVADMGGDGGLIALDAKGNVAMEFNTEGMYRAHMDAQGNLTIKIYGDE